MKNATRILCLLLVAVMVIGLLATAAFAAEEIPVLGNDGTAAGIPNDAGNITWLSDLYSQDIADAGSHQLVDSPKYVKFSYVSPKGGSTTPRLFTVDKNFFNRVGVYSNNGESYTWKGGDTSIILGANGTVCNKGLGLQPTGVNSETNTEVIFDISSFDVDHFYSLVGIIGKGNNSTYHAADMADKSIGQQKLTFILYGTKASEYAEGMEFTEIAKCENICESGMGEFNVNIEGYKFLRLVCDNVNENNGASYNNEAAWGNLCIYKAGAGNGVQDPGTNTGGSATQDATPTDNYTASIAGVYAGIPKNLLPGVTYLSRMPMVDSSNTTNADFPNGKPTCINFPYNQPEETITLGDLDMMFYKGLGMHPKNPAQPVNGSIESWTIFDVSTKNADRFYAVVGITNPAGKDGAGTGVIFRVYGDSEGNGEFKLLAQSELITGKKSGEFNVDITGVKTLKLAVVAGGNSHASSACAFGDAAIYSSTYAPETEPETQPATKAPAADKDNASSDNKAQAPSSPVGLIIGIVAAVLVVAAVVVVIIIKKKKSV